MFPLILGVLAIVGLLIRDPNTEMQVQTALISALPAQAGHDVSDAVTKVQQAAGWLGLVSIGGTLWAAIGFFGTLEFVLSEILGIRQRDPVRQRVMGLVMMFVLIVGVALGVAANAMAALVPGAMVTGPIIGAVIIIALLLTIYRLVPSRTFPVLKLLPGALLSGCCLEAVSLAFPLYVNLSHGFNTYGRQFALLFLLAAWFYLMSVLLILGAVLNHMRLGEPEVSGLLGTSAPPRPERLQLRSTRRHLA